MYKLMVKKLFGASLVTALGIALYVINLSPEQGVTVVAEANASCSGAMEQFCREDCAMVCAGDNDPATCYFSCIEQCHIAWC